jgi:hypothetical protein
MAECLNYLYSLNCVDYSVIHYAKSTDWAVGGRKESELRIDTVVEKMVASSYDKMDIPETVSLCPVKVTPSTNLSPVEYI